MFFIPFTIGALLSTLAIILIHHPDILTTKGSSFTHLAAETGPLPAVTLTLASRLSLVFLLPTGMLVTAGFTFNETFIYWFPNFAFSFLLLGIILTLHLLGDRFALAAQPVFIGLTTSCLVLLCLAGLFNPRELHPIQLEPANQMLLPILLVFPALVLFLGYDQRQESSHSSDDSGGYYIWALMVGFILLALWGFVSLKHVPQATLANTTIPYIISAREILGQPGRIIIGIAVISGTCGVVNGLFLLANRSLQQMAEQLILSPVFSPALRQRIWPVIFSLLIAIFMATGLAGSEDLEIFIYGALLFWLLITGMYCFAAARKLQKQKGTSAVYWYLLCAVFPLAAVWLAWTNVHVTTLAIFCLLVLGISAVFSSGWLWYGRKIYNKTNQNLQGDIS